MPNPAPVPATGRPIPRALALYLIYWNAQRAFDAGEFNARAFEALGPELRRRVKEIWARLYPNEEPVALGWALERLDILAERGVLPREALPAFRERIAARALRAPSGAYGPLGLLWRIHVLYLAALQAVEDSLLSRDSLPRIREAAHEQALRAVSSTLTDSGAKGKDLVPDVRAAIDAIVGELIASGLVDEGARQQLVRDPFASDDKPFAGAHCGVCGQEFEKSAELVLCVACSTPHHASCWKYNKGCAIFACGCVDSVSGSDELPAAPRFDLNEARFQLLTTMGSAQARAVIAGVGTGLYFSLFAFGLLLSALGCMFLGCGLTDSSHGAGLGVFFGALALCVGVPMLLVAAVGRLWPRG